MKKTIIISALSALMLAGSATSSLAGEPLSIDYQYEGNTGISLKAVVGGPMSVNLFTDARTDTAANDISRGAGSEPLTLTDQTAAALVQSSFASALEAAGAELGETGSPISLEGRLIEMSVQDKGDGYEVLIRCELTLRNQGRNAWQSVAFSRVETTDKDVVQAVEQGLDRLAAGLFRDDYFLMELGVL